MYMPYNKDELLKLPAEERAALAEELLSSLEDEAASSTKEEIAFAEERLRMHEQNPDEGFRLDELKRFFSEKYGF